MTDWAAGSFGDVVCRIIEESKGRRWQSDTFRLYEDLLASGAVTEESFINATAGAVVWKAFANRFREWQKVQPNCEIPFDVKTEAFDVAYNLKHAVPKLWSEDLIRRYNRLTEAWPHFVKLINEVIE